MNQIVSSKKLLTAVTTLGKEKPDFQISPDMTVVELLREFVTHEQNKARDKAEADMFLSEDQS